MKSSLAIFLHAHSYDRLYQAASLLLAATSMGWSCHLFVFYQALATYINGDWDDVRIGEPTEPHGCVPPDIEPVWMARLREGFETSNLPSLYEMLEKARSDEGELTVYGCSASVKMLGLNIKDVREKVDEIVGLPTMMKIVGDVTHAFYI
jgi:peroxiredoxin family protein